MLSDYYVVRMFFFVKQKTAYELRISDWSSDVCSSDLGGLALDVRHFSDNGLLVLGENFRQRREALLQEFVFSLFGEFLCQVHRQIELAAAVVELPGCRCRILAVVEQLAGGGIQWLSENLGLSVGGRQGVEMGKGLDVGVEFVRLLLIDKKKNKKK